MKYFLYLPILFILSSCTYVNDYIHRLTYKPALLIGYQVVGLKEGVDPIVVVDFENNSAEISHTSILLIEENLKANSYFIVEATAGGFTNNSQAIAQERTSNIIGVLESYGVPGSNIYVADYTASKPGKKGYIYLISY